MVAASADKKNLQKKRASAVVHEDELQRALNSIASALMQPANKDIAHLDMNCVTTIDLAPIVPAVRDKLFRLSLSNIDVVDTFGLMTIIENADRLFMLSLDFYKAGFDAAAINFEISKLFVRWRKNDVSELRGVHFGGIPSKALLAGFFMALMEGRPVVDDMEDIENGVVGAKFWLTTSLPTSQYTLEAKAFATKFESFETQERLSDDSIHIQEICERFLFELQPLNLVPVVDAAAATDADAAAATDADAAALQEQGVIDVAPVDSGDKYSDAKRERDRYMWQWYPYTCNSCGVVWQPNCVTVSWRQSAVSACLHNKRKCATRLEYTQMNNGLQFLTKSHELTPDPTKVVEAAAKGLIVAINPSTKGLDYFKPTTGTGKVSALFPSD